jgi:hypothetical protein
MGATRADLIGLVIANTGRSDKYTPIVNWFNVGLVRIASLHSWKDLRVQADVSVVTNDTTAALATSVKSLVELRLIDIASPTLSFAMELRPKQWFVERFPNVAGSPISGRPYFCYRAGTTLYLDRKCNSSYTIRYTYQKTAEFAGNLDESQSPITEIDDVLVAYVTAEVFRAIGQYEDANYWDQRFGNLLAAAIKDDEDETGVRYIAEQWAQRSDVFLNQPWVDPFSGHNQ